MAQRTEVIHICDICRTEDSSPPKLTLDMTHHSIRSRFSKDLCDDCSDVFLKMYKEFEENRVPRNQKGKIS